MFLAKEECSWLPGKDELSFLSFLGKRPDIVKAPCISGAGREFPSLTLTRGKGGKKTPPEHVSFFLFLGLLFFLNMEPEITFPSCSSDGRKGHSLARNILFIADRGVDGLTYQ